MAFSVAHRANLFSFLPLMSWAGQPLHHEHDATLPTLAHPSKSHLRRLAGEHHRLGRVDHPYPLTSPSIDAELYLPKCLEEKSCEVDLPLYGVLPSSSSTSNAQVTHRPKHRTFHGAAYDRRVLLPEGAARSVWSPVRLGDATLPRYNAHTSSKLRYDAHLGLRPDRHADLATPTPG